MSVTPEEMTEDLPAASGEDTPMTDENLVVFINEELANTSGGDNDDELEAAQIAGMDSYLGRARGDEIKGRSTLISMDVADVTEQTLAQLMPAFSHPNLAEFAPTGEDDEEQAMLESDAMNYLVMEKNNGYINILQSVKDGMLQRAGVLKGWIDERVEVTGETYEGVTMFDLPQLLQGDENTEIEVTSQEVVQEGITDIDPRTGQQVMIQPDVFNIEVKITKQNKALRIEPMAPEELRINQDHNSPFIGDARFVAHVRPVLRTDLIASNYDREVVMSLPAYTSNQDTETQARNRNSEETEHYSAQKMTDSVLVEECYYKIDFDNDGIAERRQVIKASSHILENRYFPLVPMAGGTPFILPHRFFGLSMYDKLKQVENTKTSFLRKTEDNAEALINQRKVVTAGEVNMDDLLASRPGGVIRERTPGSVRIEPSQPLGDTGFKMMNYMDKVRREAGGSALDLGTQENTPVANAGAHGLERFMTSQEQLTAMIAKCFAETMVQGIYLVAHWLTRTYLPQTFNFKRQGQWTEANPEQWAEREDINIVIGLSNSERSQRYQALGAIFSQQVQAMENGKDGILTSDEKIHQTLTEQARAAGLTAPEQYWINPESPEAMQARKMQAQQGQQQMQMQQQMDEQNKQLMMQLEQMKSTTKLMGDRMDFMVDQNEQLRKWYETELKYNTDLPIPGETQS